MLLKVQQLTFKGKEASVALIPNYTDLKIGELCYKNMCIQVMAHII